MRPTIPLSHWKLAVNLAETRSIQQHPDMPATNCNCAYCLNWRQVYPEVLPAELIGQLRRVGVTLESPSDSYGSQLGNGRASFRVMYHAVGKVLSGPNGWLEGKGATGLRNYVTLQETPYFLSLVVQPQDQFFDVAPEPREVSGKLLQIDFRMEVPWRLLPVA